MSYSISYDILHDSRAAAESKQSRCGRKRVGIDGWHWVLALVLPIALCQFSVFNSLLPLRPTPFLAPPFLQHPLSTHHRGHLSAQFMSVWSPLRLDILPASLYIMRLPLLLLIDLRSHSPPPCTPVLSCSSLLTLLPPLETT